MIKKILINLLVVVGFLFISFFFYHRVFWSELFYDRSTIGAVHGEIQATEWSMEKIYQNLINRKNPFKPIKEILYPFGLDLVGGDAGSAFNYIFFRPFLSPHQSLMIIVVVNYIFANIGMYFLLRRMGMTKLVSFLIGLAYGNMTFLTVRSGHPGYSFIYLFPWILLLWLIFIKTKNIYKKFILTIIIPLSFAMTLWQNMYYFIILLIAYVSLVGYLLVKRRKVFFDFFIKNFRYFILMFMILTLILVPWLSELYKSIYFGESANISGWNGAIEFSSDIFGVFIPSIHNFYYGKMILDITKKIPFAAGIFENFTYPGIIILFIYLLIIIFRNKIPEKIKEIIAPYFLVSLVFYILTLGPFLHIAGNWYIQLEENIRLVFPLPFIILHYIPFIGNIRAPGRLIVGFIFFAYIVSAYIINYLIRNKSKKYLILFFVITLLLIMIDQRPNDKILAEAYFYPKKIYGYIEKDNSKNTVLEIPFSVRDGFTYLGNMDAIGMTIGQSYHQKPIIGGYSGRIPNYVKDYYKNNPMIGYLGRIIDKNISSNPNIELNDLPNWVNPNINESKRAADFLNIKYIILNKSLYFDKKIPDYLYQFGYNIKLKEKNYYLYERDPVKQEYLEVDLISGDNLQIGLGWNLKEEKFRWSNRRNSVLFKIQEPRDMLLNFNAASFYKGQFVKIYVNEKKIGQLFIDTITKKRQIKIDKKYFTKGINTVHFIFNKSYKPSDIIPDSLDKRELSGQFSKIWLTNQK